MHNLTVRSLTDVSQLDGGKTYMDLPILLIEKHGANTIDGHYWHEPDGETWFKLSADFERYEPCKKPDCLVGVVSFA